VIILIIFFQFNRFIFFNNFFNFLLRSSNLGLNWLLGLSFYSSIIAFMFDFRNLILNILNNSILCSKLRLVLWLGSSGTGLSPFLFLFLEEIFEESSSELFVSTRPALNICFFTILLTCLWTCSFNCEMLEFVLTGSLAMLLLRLELLIRMESFFYNWFEFKAFCMRDAGIDHSLWTWLSLLKHFFLLLFLLLLEAYSLKGGELISNI
jgi:hypothetical protein